MQLFIFSVSKTFYSVLIYIFIRFLKNYIHFNRHKVNPIYEPLHCEQMVLYEPNRKSLSELNWFCEGKYLCVSLKKKKVSRGNAKVLQENAKKIPPTPIFFHSP